MWTGKLSRRGRWAVPGGALLATGAVLAGMQLPLAQASPSLPAKTPAQLIAWVITQGQKPAERALSGTITETASLGIPRLPGLQDQRSLLGMLSGSHTVKVWIAPPDRYRIELPGRMSETDLYANGSTVWLWDSAANTATKLSVGQGMGWYAYAPPSSSSAYSSQLTITASPAGAPTPQQIAAQILAAVGPSTLVSTDSNVIVAGRAAYELRIAPRSSQSTIGSIRIAIDGQNQVPLRVQIYARDASTPAFSVGFTDVTFATPSKADTSFTPPPGAHITQAGQGSARLMPGHDPSRPGDYGTSGTGWLTVVKLPAAALNAAAQQAGSSTAPVSLNGGPGEQAFAIQAALNAASPVRGVWGSGRLLHTALFNVLITDNGEMFLGAVEPELLYQAAAGH
jgi:outer membrane lipoprotein-sorting protein